MSKIIRVRTYGVRNYKGGQVWPLEPIDGSVSVWYRSTEDVCLVAHFSDGISIPLHVGKYLDQNYHFEKNISNLEIVASSKASFAIRMLQDGTRYRDVADPIPYRAVVPIDRAVDSMENRVLRAVDAALSARGLPGTKAKGHQYDEDDDEFGPGYQYDEALDEEIEAAAVKAVAAKFAPAKGVQPAGDDDSDKSVRGELGTTQPNPNPATKPGDNNSPQ